jgi:hypothetical protein
MFFEIRTVQHVVLAWQLIIVQCAFSFWNLQRIRHCHSELYHYLVRWRNTEDEHTRKQIVQILEFKILVWHFKLEQILYNVKCKYLYMRHIPHFNVIMDHLIIQDQTVQATWTFFIKEFYTLWTILFITYMAIWATLWIRTVIFAWPFAVCKGLAYQLSDETFSSRVDRAGDSGGSKPIAATSFTCCPGRCLRRCRWWWRYPAVEDGREERRTRRPVLRTDGGGLGA